MVAALATVGALLVPAAAFADQIDISSNSIRWSGVEDTTGYIEDGDTYDAANNAYGWNSDALDGLPDPFTLFDPDQGRWDFIATTSESNIVQGGTSTITMTGTTADFADPYTVVLTLTLQGNYAHWSYAISNPTIGLENSSVSFTGNIGSDSDSEYVATGNTLVSDDTGFGDPVLGYNVVTDGTFGSWIVAEGNDNPEATATAAGHFDVYLVLYGYTPCANGFATATAAVTSLVPTLPSTFGERYDDAGSCITVTPVSLTRDVAANEVLSYTVDAFLTTPSDYFTDSFFTDRPVSTVVDDLPAGLTATSVAQEDGSIIVTISGTPTVSGTFTSRLLFAQDNGDGGFVNQVLGSIVFTVADPAAAGGPVLADPPAVGGPVLANTGVDAAGAMGLASALLLAGIGSLLFVRRRRA